jgi:hypothetical protein
MGQSVDRASGEPASSVGRAAAARDPTSLTMRLDDRLHGDLVMLASHLDKIAVTALARGLLRIAVEALKQQLFVTTNSDPS